MGVLRERILPKNRHDRQDSQIPLGELLHTDDMHLYNRRLGLVDRRARAMHMQTQKVSNLPLVQVARTLVELSEAEKKLHVVGPATAMVDRSLQLQFSETLAGVLQRSPDKEIILEEITNALPKSGYLSTYKDPYDMQERKNIFDDLLTKHPNITMAVVMLGAGGLVIVKDIGWLPLVTSATAIEAIRYMGSAGKPFRDILAVTWAEYSQGKEKEQPHKKEFFSRLYVAACVDAYDEEHFHKALERIGEKVDISDMFP